MAEQISFSAESFKRFKAEYLKAKEAAVETFVFDGKEFVVDYAKYLIEYLESRFNR